MLTTEARKGIEELLDSGFVTNPVLLAWLKHQLAADDWDKSVEKMGGGRKARDGYMKPFFDAACSVTAFDMHAQMTTDGRERGLWIWLDDQSKARAHTYARWADMALKSFCERQGLEDGSMEKLTAMMSMDEFKNVSNSKVHEAALLEWPKVKELHAAIGREIEKHEAKNGAVKARTPRKPDRRATKRRQDDKTKARLKR